MKNILDLFELQEGRYRPDPLYNYHNDQKYRLDQQFLALLVGIVALGLPVVMIVGWAAGVAGMVPDMCFRDSISHFYYTRFLGAVLVSALAFIGSFLLAYRGDNPKESRLATFAGVFAFGVALFPTTGSGCERDAFAARILANFGMSPGSETAKVEVTGPFFELFPYVDILHFGSAALLFSFLAYYTFFVFTREDEGQRGPDERFISAKWWRNLLYRVSGAVICLAMLFMLVKLFAGEWAWWTRNNVTFWCEAAALWAFGFSWMVKGRFLRRFDLLIDPRDRLPPPPQQNQ